jgi:hypothetical protein
MAIARTRSKSGINVPLRKLDPDRQLGRKPTQLREKRALTVHQQAKRRHVALQKGDGSKNGIYPVSFLYRPVANEGQATRINSCICMKMGIERLLVRPVQDDGESCSIGSAGNERFAHLLGARDGEIRVANTGLLQPHQYSSEGVMSGEPKLRGEELRRGLVEI